LGRGEAGGFDWDLRVGLGMARVVRFLVGLGILPQIFKIRIFETN
jgi:hypothetical protein